MIGKLKDLMRLASGEWVVSFTTRDDPGTLFDDLKNEAVRVDIKKNCSDGKKTAQNFSFWNCTTANSSAVLLKCSDSSSSFP